MRSVNRYRFVRVYDTNGVPYTLRSTPANNAHASHGSLEVTGAVRVMSHYVRSSLPSCPINIRECIEVAREEYER